MFSTIFNGSLAVDKLLDYIQQPVVLINTIGDITCYNSAFAKLFTPEEFGSGLQNVLNFADQVEHANITDFLNGAAEGSVCELTINIAVRAGDTGLTIKRLGTNDDGKAIYVGLGEIVESRSRRMQDKEDLPWDEFLEAKVNEKRMQLVLEHENRRDALTGLGNRRKLIDDQSALFKDAAKTGATPAYALMQIDLDHFKQVNENFGHEGGDAVLTHVSDIFARLVGDKGSVSRIGGDEFSILLTKERRKLELLKIAEQIIKEVSQPFDLDGTAIEIGVSIGIASSACQGADPLQTQANADQALQDAKNNGSNCVQFFSERFVDEDEFFGT